MGLQSRRVAGWHAADLSVAQGVAILIYAFVFAPKRPANNDNL